MKKAGGIIAIIAGVFAVIAAFITLAVGGVGGALGGKDAQTVVMLGWGGVLFSFLTIIFGAITIGATSKTIPILLIICSILGMILGGTFVAIFMFLVLAAGIVSYFGVKKELKTTLTEQTKL